MINNTSLLAAIAGLILVLHLYLLLATRKAFATPIAQGSCAACGDHRENSIREMTVFGGSAAFDFGLLYWLLAALSSGWLSSIFLAYAWMRTWATLIQIVLFLVQVSRTKIHSPIRLKAHLNGCGYTTAVSPFWWLYWLGLISFLKRPILTIRDFLTRLDFLFSLPAMLLLNALLLLRGQRVLPEIGAVASQT